MYNNALYKHMPIFMQNSYVSLLSFIKLKLRATKKAENLTKKLLQQETDVDAVNQYQQAKLSAMIKNAKSTPFYQNLEIKTDSLLNFPYISKNDISQKPLDFFNSDNKEKRFSGTTSGTTGQPLTIFQNLDSIMAERAFSDRYRLWAGFKPGDKRAWIRGDLIVPLMQKKAPFWRYSYFENTIMLSSFHMKTSVLGSYIQAMVDYGVDIIHAYPSSIVTLAVHLKQADEYYPSTLKSILTSSESLSKEDKLLIEERFKCPVFDWYGLFERVAAIASCEHGRYHILTDYSHVELLAAGEVNGKRRAEVVGTNFNNSMYPLIRYKTNDHVIFSDEKNCPCGRAYPIIDSIEGRQASSVFAFDGTPVFAMGRCIQDIKGVLGCQYLQDKLKEINILVIGSSEFDSPEENKLMTNVQARLGKKMKVNIRKVESLIRTKNGKVKQIICEVDANV